MPAKPNSQLITSDPAVRVVAVAVTYHPCLTGFRRLLEALLPQVEAIVVVDNASGSAFRAFGEARGEFEHYLFLSENLGIAEAQNRGIAHARGLGASHVLLFDQDSIPAPDMLVQLLQAMTVLARRGLQLGAVGPAYEDPRGQVLAAFTRLRGWCVERITKGDADGLAEVDHLIASGCLIPLVVLDRVGDMRAELFIDYVDVEWGLRARAAGYPSFVAFGARMQHTLGDVPIRVLGRSITAHSPLRRYYQFRNALALYRLPHVSLAWKFNDLWRLLRKFVIYAWAAQPRGRQLQMMLLGLWHGVLGRTGPL